MKEAYSHPEVLVETDWLADHLNDSGIRIVESDEDYLLYDTGHVPNAVKIDWFTTLQDPVRRDFLNKPAFEKLCSEMGITNDTTVIFYGDKNNWFAAYSLWLFNYYGHDKTKILNGGRLKWQKEGRPMTKEVPSFPKTSYRASDPRPAIRAYRDDVFQHLQRGGRLVDVRSPSEFTGEMLHMPNYPQEGASRGGHIPGAVNVPWSQAVREEDGTFKSPEELKKLYESKAVTPEEPVIAYCRIGERSSHTWFVLRYLLGYPDVRNYDGSWTEWGNLVDAPIEKGEGQESRSAG
jgi:thiosulfate/3-mercaptopyruvate sulfurtransferase